MLFGQSYQLFGLNSFAVADLRPAPAWPPDLPAHYPTMSPPRLSPFAEPHLSALSTRAQIDEATGNISRFGAERSRENFDLLVGQPALWQPAPPRVELELPHPAAEPPRRRLGQTGDQAGVVTGGARWDLGG